MNPFKQHRAMIMRIFWFGVGGALSILLNTGLFRLLTTGLRWSQPLAYGVSLAAVNVLLFVWNYFVGFRTTTHWTVAARRQVVCIASSNLLNYALVMILLGVFPRWPEAVIAAVQVLIAGFKFVLYHYWVYPAPAAAPGSAFVSATAQAPGEEC